MALTLVKETGVGLSNANTYALVADGDAYHEAHLYAASWTGANDTKKQQALAMASRLIDQSFQFFGRKTQQGQALQWPRAYCPDPDADAESAFESGQDGAYLPDMEVPKEVIDAACEMARRLLDGDRTGDPDGEGIESLDIGGAIAIKFDKGDAAPTVPREVTNPLSKYGTSFDGKSGTVRLTRA